MRANYHLAGDTYTLHVLRFEVGYTYEGTAGSRNLVSTGVMFSERAEWFEFGALARFVMGASGRVETTGLRVGVRFATILSLAGLEASYRALFDNGTAEQEVLVNLYLDLGTPIRALTILSGVPE